jgi:NAD(P)-dependent dehydrogenase (short-subunit alcohol dehydrogenase family)
MLRVALVTGAGEGIGAAVAHRLSRDGLAVGVNDLDPARAEAVASEIVAAGGRALPLAGDIADVARVRAMVDETVAAFGRLDVAVANAGITQYGDFFDMTAGDIDRLLSANRADVVGDRASGGALSGGLWHDQSGARTTGEEPRHRTVAAWHHDQHGRARRNADAAQLRRRPRV